MAAFNRIPTLSLHESLLFPLVSGLAVHFVYKKYEVNPSRSFATVFLLLVAPLASSIFLLQHYAAYLAVLIGISAFYITLLSSIVLYRISPWHPLARYPGPFLAKVSQSWLAYVSVKGKWHEVLKDLHAQHGPYVRVGPNQLSFIDATLIPKIMGPDGMPKGPMFDGARMPGVPANVVAVRDLKEHTQLRKPWAQGLSSASTREYIPIVKRRALQLTEALEKYAEMEKSDVQGLRSADLAMWLTRFTFDFMGDMAFGGAFELMRDGDTSGIWSLINDQMKGMALLERLPWSTHLVHKLPGVVEGMAKFTKFVDDCVHARLRRGPLEKDLFYHLANEDTGPNKYGNFTLLSENTKVAIVAGSDTTSTTLSNMFYYLLTNPGDFRRLREELDKAFPPGEGDPFDFTRLSDLPILNAVINETLRLLPPVPTDLQRAPTASSGGKQIGEHWIPEGTSVNVPPYVLHRQARYFSDPETFIIDRWLQPSLSSSTSSETEKKSKLPNSTAHWVHDTSAYIPFSFGPANCAGKMLALSELRSVTALLLQRFDMKLEPGYDPARWEKEMKNHFVTRLGPLPVIVTLRNHA